MSTKVEPVPAGYGAVTPYMVVHDAAAALEFYRRAFGAEEVMRMAMPDGRVGHAEMRIGGSMIMLCDEFPDMNAYSPRHYRGSPVTLLVYVPDVDAVAAQAVEAGATLESPVKDQFYGDRMGTLLDPFGHRWYVATHVEDVPPDELERRSKAAFQDAG